MNEQRINVSAVEEVFNPYDEIVKESEDRIFLADLSRSFEYGD